MRNDFGVPARLGFSDYLRRRRTIFIVAYVGYAACYLVRNNVKVTSTLLAAQFDWSPQQIGYVLTAFTFAYGIGKVVMGAVVDRFGTRLIFSVGLGSAAVLCLAMSVLPGLGVLVVLMAISGLVQGACAPAAMASLGAWYPNRQRGARIALWNTSQNVGAGLLPLIIAGSLAISGPQHVALAFIVPGAIVLIVAIWAYWAGGDKPWQENIPTLTEMYGSGGLPSLPPAREVSYWRLVRVHVLTNRKLVILAVINVLLYFVRFGLLNWMPTFLHRDKGLDFSTVSFTIAAFEWGAIPGALLFALIAWLRPNRTAVWAALGSLSVVGAVVAYVLADNTAAIMIAAASLGVLTYGPQVVIGILTLNFAPQKVVGVAIGMVGVGGYLIGEASANLGLPLLASVLDWPLAFMTVALAALAASVLYLSLRKAEATAVLTAQ